MVNPYISKKNSKTFTTAEEAKKIFKVIYKEQNKEETSEDQVPKINVSDLISKMSFYYEKIRNTVDYKEEHLLRKDAIERILKRQIVIEGALSIKGSNPEEISRHLLTELIRAGYLPNNKIPEKKINEIAIVIDKYLRLRDYSLRHYKNFSFNDKTELSNWIMSISASEVEDLLGEKDVDSVIIQYMYKILLKNIELPDNNQYVDDDEIQIYIGIHRNFLKYDRAMLGLILFKYFNANWENASDNEVERIAKKIMIVKEAIDKQIDHPLAGQLNRLIKRYTVFFSVLKDVIEEDPRGVYDSFKKDPKAFPRMIKNVCNKRYKSARKKLWRGAFRSIIYILITKSVFVLILEYPAIKWLGEEANISSLLINVSFPAVLLFLVVLFTRLPSATNTKKIVEGIEEVVFMENERKDPFKLRKPAKRSKVLSYVFGVAYAVTFILSFGAIIWVLDKVNFNWISIIIFIFFLAFVSFFSIRIRKTIKELMIIPPRENILSFFADFFYVPIVEAGKWLSEKFSQINVFVFILDFIIEAPFKIFVEIAEEWTKYVKERKEDI